MPPGQRCPTNRCSMQLANRILALSAAAALAACGRGSSATVTFGAAGPWHDANGAEDRRGVELALDEINSGSGRPYHFDVQFKDDSANGVRAAGVAQEFVSDPNVVAVIGHVNSGAML